MTFISNPMNECSLSDKIAALIKDAATPNVRARTQANATSMDPQIVGIIVAANQINIGYAKLALSRSKNSNVRDFAWQMVADHSAVEKSVRQIGAKLKCAATDSVASKALKARSGLTFRHLKVLTGKSFDKAYIDDQVAYCKVASEAVANALIPNAQNAELKEALAGAHPLFQCHLEHAQIVQAAVNGTDLAEVGG